MPHGHGHELREQIVVVISLSVWLTDGAPVAAQPSALGSCCRQGVIDANTGAHRHAVRRLRPADAITNATTVAHASCAARRRRH